MTIPFYAASVASYSQTLTAMAGVLDQGETFARENDLDLEELVQSRLREDMAPFSFQVISVWHHSRGALEGCKAGLFAPPPKMDDMNFARCKALIAEARDYMEAQTEDAINALTGGSVVFRLGDREIPFTTDDFLLSFSLPNFYFHATTTYAFLRMRGVPLGKRDYLGPLRINA